MDALVKEPAVVRHKHPYGDLPVVLVTGIGRSGTTVVTKCIQQHSRIYSNGVESNIIHDILTTGVRNCEMQSRRRQLIISQSQYEQEFKELILHLRFPVERTTVDKPAALSTYSQMAPELTGFFERMFRKPVWVVVVRNGIEVVASRSKHRAFGKVSFEKNCEVWSRSVEMFRFAKRSNHAVILRHEELLDSTRVADCLSAVFAKAGLEYEKGCGDFVMGSVKHCTEVAEETEESSKDLFQRRNRWKYWTNHQKSLFRSICRSAMEELGYEVPF